MAGALLLLGLAALAITLASVALARTADALADRTGLGEAVVGTLLLAGATSLPDLAATITAAAAERPSLAMSNALGSMAANFAFLAVADGFHRRANLEHAAASAANLTQAALLVALLALPLVGALAPDVHWLGVHPATPLVVLAYLGGLRLVRRADTTPMWQPTPTAQTVKDEPQPGSTRHSAATLWLRFGGLAAVVTAAGWLAMEATRRIADAGTVSDTMGGALLSALATSLPELVTTITAVRRGALTLAVSNVLGTNCINVFVIAAADVAYRPGSVYHAIGRADLAWALVAILMTAVLLLGMLRRQTYGLGRIGFESVLVLVLYGVGIALTALA